MYETHNPGFCYHCTGALRECGPVVKEKTPRDSYGFVRSVIFTNDEVDPHKLLCLHLLTAHSTKWSNNDSSAVRPVTPLLEKAKKRHFTGAWNNFLTCYVVDAEDASADATIKNVKLHEDPRNKILEDQTIQDLEKKCRQYMDNNDDLGRVLSSNVKNTKIVQQGLEKMPTISPHVYSLLGPSHELRIKQALAEGMPRRKLARSSMELSAEDRNSYSFHLNDDDEDDDAFSGATTNESNRNWVTRSTRSPSKRSTIGSIRLDHGITMLKSKRGRSDDSSVYRSKNHDANKDIISIKSSFRVMKDVSSRTSSVKSPLRGVLGNRLSSSSFLSVSMNPDAANPFRKRVYLITPRNGWAGGRNDDRRVVPILVNYQVQALVQAVLDVLSRVNPEKSRMIIEAAGDTNEIRKMLLRSEMQSFVRSLAGQSLMSSPESYVVSVATVMDEIDVRFAGIPRKEIVALTLEMPPAPCLEALIAEIRDNIFHDTARNTARLDENTREISSVPDEQKAAKESIAKNASNTMQAVGKREEMCGECNTNLLGTKRNKNDRARKFGDVGKRTERMNNKRGESSKENRTAELERNFSITGTGEKSSGYGSREIKSGRSLWAGSLTKTDEHRLSSGNVHAKRTPNAKSWKAAQDLGHLDADHVILRRMTNTQRILVGQMCASLKSKRINKQGLINENVPLAALIAPVLSRNSIKFLTRGTVYSKTSNIIKQQEEMEENVAVPDKITGPLLAKIRQEVAENETKRRLKLFLKENEKKCLNNQ
ncbi:uncharacterized protein LOC116430671 [Nomia melanderi]|uniref:uncharacterized protein LOC116430671 n=1 Tax=Nomia melanderi TaxID=2448451 RepID=UPI003FCEA6FF